MVDGAHGVTRPTICGGFNHFYSPSHSLLRTSDGLQALHQNSNTITSCTLAVCKRIAPSCRRIFVSAPAAVARVKARPTLMLASYGRASSLCVGSTCDVVYRLRQQV